MLVIALVLFWPVGYAFYLSFQHYKLGDVAVRFAGFSNYLYIFNEQRFWSALQTTMIIAFSALTLELISGLLLALGLYKLKKGAGALIVVLFLPFVVTPVVSALFLKWMFVSNWGLLDATLTSIGLPTLDWLGSPTIAKVTVVLADAWVSTPLIILTLFAALQQIDSSQLEAARIDGATGTQTLRFVMLPALAPMLVFVASVRLMDMFRQFDLIFVLTGGGPGTATTTVTMLTYQWAFRLFDVAKSSALGIVTMLIVFMIVVLIAFATPRLLGRSPS
ncbi:sugar ABC transporter permease [Corticibacterium sp. UT-5YL-CI-8]|nr:sugar ABC transporter permease [Tianweitania sp. UT-5YL-CI-8]